MTDVPMKDRLNAITRELDTFQREMSSAVKRLTLTLLVVTILGAGAIGLAAWGFAQTANQRANIVHLALVDCRQLELVKSRIRLVISTSAKTLGKKGSAGYDYYRLHPTELAQAIAATKIELETFNPLPCDSR